MDTRPVDPFRFSQATLEDTQEDELNAILGELSALQLSLDREIKPQGSPNHSSVGQNAQVNMNVLPCPHPNQQGTQNQKAMSTTSDNGKDALEHRKDIGDSYDTSDTGINLRKLLT